MHDHRAGSLVDSLVIARTAARVRQRLRVDPPLAAYFDAGTVADLAQVVAGAPPLSDAPARAGAPALPAGAS